MVLDLQTGPTEEPITLQEAKEHLRVDGTDDDTYIITLISAARLYCEKLANKSFVTQTWDLYFDDFPGAPFEIPLGPVQTVSSIIYTDSDLDSTTVTAGTYIVDKHSLPARVNLAYGYSWPTATLNTLNAIRVRFIAGYGDAADVPEDVKQAILMLMAHMYENREQTVTASIGQKAMAYGIEELLGIDRVWTFA